MIYKARQPRGCATDPGFLADPAYAEIVRKHYQIIVPEVCGKYSTYVKIGWTDMDKLVAWALANDKRLHYHTLLWWDLVPPDPEAWITEALTRYPMILDWDVVNEGYYPSGAIHIPGIEDAFEIVRRVRPEVTRWYNGILRDAGEQEAVLRLVQSGLVQEVGFQMHLGFDSSLECYIPLLQQLKAMGVPWAVSELDVMILGDTADWLVVQADKYRQVREMCRTFGARELRMWGVTDNTSWREPYYPLPWDCYCQAKPAWEAIHG
jgi:endo-1,4-beta-xylanase